MPIEDLLPDVQAKQLKKALHALVEDYRASLSGNLRHLIDRYEYADAARKVVGVGSVGTRAWVVLMLGRDRDDPLFLQAKEATRSVLEPFAGKSEFDNQGRRVVEGQRLMQAASDIFLGWLRTHLASMAKPVTSTFASSGTGRARPTSSTMRPSDMAV